MRKFFSKKSQAQPNSNSNSNSSSPSSELSLLSYSSENMHKNENEEDASSPLLSRSGSSGSSDSGSSGHVPPPAAFSPHRHRQNSHRNHHHDDTDPWHIFWNHLHTFNQKNYKFVVSLWFLIIWPAGLYSLPKLMKAADSTFEPLKGTPSYDALHQYQHAYSYTNSNSSSSSSSSIHITSQDPQFKPIIALFQLDLDSNDHDKNWTLIDESSPYFNMTRDYIFNYTQYLYQTFPLETPDDDGNDNNTTSSNTSISKSSSISSESFYHLYSEFPLLAQQTLASQDGTLVLLKINPPSQSLPKSQLFHFLDLVTNYIHIHPPPSSCIKVQFTGLSLFQQDMMISSKSDVASLDHISLPLSLLILAYVLQASLPLLILPMCTILSTMALWSVILFVILKTTHMTMAQFTPSIMMSLTIAMSVDYSLFYLSRMLEELQSISILPHPHNNSNTNSNTNSNNNSNSDNNQANHNMNMSHEEKRWYITNANRHTLSTAGHSILVSGSTLSMCLIGLTILPLDMMVSTGIGSSIAVLSCIVVNLVVLPSMLYTNVGQWVLLYPGISSSIVRWRKYKRKVSIHGCKKWWRQCSRRYRCRCRCRYRCRQVCGRLQNHNSSNDNDNQDHNENGGVDETPLLLSDQLLAPSSQHVHDSDQYQYTTDTDDDDDDTDVHSEMDLDKMTELESLLHSNDYDSMETVKSSPTSSHSPHKQEQEQDSLSTQISPLQSECSPLTFTFQQQQQSSQIINFNDKVSPWRRMGEFILLNHTRSKLILLLVVGILILPISYFLFQLQTSIAMEFMLPQDSPSFMAFQVLGKYFGKGALSPYQIIFDGTKSHRRIDSSQGFDFMHRVLRNLTNEDMQMHMHMQMQYYNQNHIKDKDILDKELLESILESNESKKIWMESLRSFMTEQQQQQQQQTYQYQPQNHDHDHKSTHSPISLYTTKNLHNNKHNDNDNDNNNFPATPTLSSFSGISTLNGTLIPYPVYEIALMCDEIAAEFHSICPIPALHALNFLSNKTCSSSHYATSVTAILDVDPFTNAGVDWLKSARAVLQNMTYYESEFEVYIIGGAAIEYDAIDAIFVAFPLMIGLTTMIVFLFMGISFQSIGAPIRSILSIGATLCFVYGLAVLVYQYGALDWMHLRCVSNVGAISFLPPIMAFTVVVGLGLDYDVFLSTRILEYRSLGYTHTSSILLGLEKTGYIITAAGIIMCVAFGGLLFSDSLVLNQFSFFLVASVMLDTFVVRTVLVPVVLELCGDHWGWWPRVFPAGVKSVLVGGRRRNHEINNE